MLSCFQFRVAWEGDYERITSKKLEIVENIFLSFEKIFLQLKIWIKLKSHRKLKILAKILKN